LRYSNQKKRRDLSGSKVEIVELIPDDDDDGVLGARASSLIMLGGS
jgi:hypothetical protein